MHRRTLTKNPSISSILAILAWLGLASNASALIITGGATYTLPGGGSCSVSGVACQTGGATLTCTGVNLAAHTHVYFGIKNNTNVTGNTMTGVAPTAGSPAVFRYASSTGTSITYTSSTTVNDALTGSQPISSQLILTATSGSAAVIATGGNPASNTSSDIERVFQITSSNFNIRADVKASGNGFGLGQACPAVYDPSHTSGQGEINKVDLAFYVSDCGDGQVDGPEQCDLGGSNGSSSTCCKSDCTFQPNTFVCRPGAPDGLCDTPESCSGGAATCPPDDAPLNGGNVCRAGSGDSCDANETCTGTPGQNCPADDAPGNAGNVCRPSSVAGSFCDEDEVCSGIPGQTCPPNDAPLKVNVVCRPGSGDICDPDERCTGISGQGCPPDVVANPLTVCRAGSGDVCDPAEHCTAIPTQPCPSNVILPANTVCRPSVGVCDTAEECNGVTGAPCPVNTVSPAGTPCEADSNQCTVDKCNNLGLCVFSNPLNCDDGNTCTQDSCNSGSGCVHSGTPSNSCMAATRGKFQFRNSSDNRRDRVKFSWNGGPVTVNDMGDPTQTTRYELCVYDGDDVIAMGVAPGPGWRTIGSPSAPRGYKYKDRFGQSQGVTKITLKASSVQNAKLQLTGKGDLLPDPTIPFLLPLTAQLYNSDGSCWDMEFDLNHTKRNADGTYYGKTP